MDQLVKFTVRAKRGFGTAELELLDDAACSRRQHRTELRLRIQYPCMSFARLPVSKDRRKQRLPSLIPRIRLQTGELFAEIIHDRRSRPALFFVVVQRRGSAEILLLEHFSSRSEAEASAKQFMADCSSRRELSREWAA